MSQAWTLLAGVVPASPVPAASILASSVPAFLAALVEFVEALTVVLALGATRGWAGALAGAAAGLATLAVLVAAFGPALAAADLAWLRGAVGLLVLLFGLRWLRKAILRAAGAVDLHDEAATYARIRGEAGGARGGWDGLALAGAFQVVMLEGGEVVFIVLAMGAGAGRLMPAACGAALALAVVVALGAALHRPLTRIPENTLKFAVGVLLTALGTCWTGEAIGVVWPGGDWSLILNSLLWAAAALSITALARRPATA